MRIREANKMIAQYMGEKLIEGKGVTKIEIDGEVLPTGYHCSYDWLLPVIKKLAAENKLTKEVKDKISNLEFYVYSDVVNIIASFVVAN